MGKERLSAKKITIWICVNYVIFVLGFFILGSMGTDKFIVWSNFILDVFLVAVSLALNILLFKRKYQTPLLGKIALLLATLCFGMFTYFAFLIPENGLPAILFSF